MLSNKPQHRRIHQHSTPAPQIKIRECASCKKCCPAARALAHEVKSFTVQVRAGVLPRSPRAHGPSPLRLPWSLLEAPSPGPPSLPLLGGLEKWNDNYYKTDFPGQRGSLVSVPPPPNQKVFPHQDLWQSNTFTRISVLMAAISSKRICVAQYLQWTNTFHATNVSKCQLIEAQAKPDAIFTLYASYSQRFLKFPFGVSKSNSCKIEPQFLLATIKGPYIGL